MNKIHVDVSDIDRFVQNVKNRCFVKLNSLVLSKLACRPCLKQVIESGLCVVTLKVDDIEASDFELIKSIKGLVKLCLQGASSFSALELVKMNPSIKCFKIFEAYPENFLSKIDPADFDLIIDRREVEFEDTEDWFTLEILVFRDWLKGNIPNELLEKLIEKGFIYYGMERLPVESLYKFYNSSLGKLYITKHKAIFLKGDQYIDKEGIILIHLQTLLVTQEEKSKFIALAFRFRAWSFVLSQDTIPPFLNDDDFYRYVNPDDIKTQYQLVCKDWRPNIQNDDLYRYKLLRLMLHVRGVIIEDVNEILARCYPYEMVEFLKYEKVVPLNENEDNLYHYVLKNGRWLQLEQILKVIVDFSPFFSKNKSGKTPLDYTSKDQVQAIMKAKEIREAK